MTRFATLLVSSLILGCSGGGNPFEPIVSPILDVGVGIDVRVIGPDVTVRPDSGTVDPNVQLATYDCIAGQPIAASCGCMQLGAPCGGDPTLTLCDGAASTCTRDSSLVYNDDSCGNCPLVQTTCPSSGRITVRAAPFSSASADYACDYAIVDANGPLTRR